MADRWLMVLHRRSGPQGAQEGAGHKVTMPASRTRHTRHTRQHASVPSGKVPQEGSAGGAVPVVGQDAHNTTEYHPEWPNWSMSMLHLDYCTSHGVPCEVNKIPIDGDWQREIHERERTKCVDWWIATAFSFYLQSTQCRLVASLVRLSPNP